VQTQSQSRADALIAQYIEEHPRKVGKDEVWLKEHHISVWAIVGTWKGRRGDANAVAYEYDIPIEAVEAALAYYTQNTAVIDNRRAQNYPPEYDDYAAAHRD